MARLLFYSKLAVTLQKQILNVPPHLDESSVQLVFHVLDKPTE